MKKFSATRTPVSRAKARNAALLNQLATPGLGSLLCGRWLAGTGQLILFFIGFVIFVWWFVEDMRQFYGQISGDVAAKPIGGILETGVAICAVAWCWSLVTSFSILREAEANTIRPLQNAAAPPPLKLGAPKIVSALATIPNWRQNGDAISRAFQFKDFPEAVKFVNAVAEIAEREWHHPDIDIRWNKVTLALTTHDAGGLTEKDFALARQFDALLPAR